MLLRKKLIEVALPLDAINKASAREKSIRHGHPSTLHLWWARRPLAAARAVIFGQMVDDPSSHPELFFTEEAQEAERRRLFGIIEELVKWENTTNEEVLKRARDEIWKSWRATCAEYWRGEAGSGKREGANGEQGAGSGAGALYDPDKLPAFHDPFAGGGSLPLEAQRLGLEAHASDLNPVAVLINKAMIEIPPKFAGRPPVNPEARSREEGARGVKQGVLPASCFALPPEWRGAEGLAEDVRYYGRWMRDEAEKRIGHLYPKVEVTAEMAQERPDLRPYVGQKLTVIAWLWARTVKSPNPAYAHVDVPLAATFMLSTKPGKEAYVEPVVEGGTYRFTVKVGKPKDAEAAQNGTKLARANFRCLVSGTPIPGDYIKTEGQVGRMGTRLMAVVAEGERGRAYVSPNTEHEAITWRARPAWKPDVEFLRQALGFRIGSYGLSKWSDLFTPRQLVALTTLSDLIHVARERAERDALEAGLPDEDRGLEAGGKGARAYAEAVAVYLAFAVDRISMTGNSLVRWNAVGEKAQHCFGRQALPMVWDFAEPNPLASATGSIDAAVFYSCDPLNWLRPIAPGSAWQDDAASLKGRRQTVISTDPPYYDNIGYADLADFFYVWLRRTLGATFPGLFATLAVPKAEELVATPYRHGGKEQAESFFLKGMTRAMQRLAEQAHPAFPVTIYYAFKQVENDGDAGVASTGWETFLDAAIRAGFGIQGTWPIRTENNSRLRGQSSNALASSIVLVCRARPADAPSATRREFLAALKAELPAALAHLQHANIAPVDLAQAAIGPGMAVYTRYSQVLDATGSPVTVREALSLINQTLDEVLAEQEGELDADTRWALAWFEQSGFAQGEYGVAETLSTAKNTSVGGLAEAGILAARAGKVRLLKPEDLPANWDPATDPRLTIWEMVHHLVRVLETGGESAAAGLLARLGSQAETARSLAYRLYTICERKKWAPEALSYNGLVQSWPEIARLAREREQAGPQQGRLL